MQKLELSPSGITHGSLFSGIGGFDLGFERAGIETVWQVEIEDYCRRVLARHFPRAKRYDDVRTVGSHNLEPVDIISGGFPCQDISNAGKRAGIDGERSGLWSEYARIIRELRPRYVVVENVAALLGRGMERVLGDLAACGYDAEWQSISAAHVGAPHLRERIWILAYPRCGFSGSSGDGENKRGAGALAASGESEGVLADADGQRPSSEWDGLSKGQNNPTGASSGTFPDAESFGLQGQRPSGEQIASAHAGAGLLVRGSQIFSDTDRESLGRIAESWGQRGEWAVEPNVGRVADGIPARVDRLRGLGNAIVPQIAEWIGRRIVDAEQRKTA